MAKTYAVCQINGLIRFVDQPPAEGHISLAVGELGVVRQVIRETAEPVPAPRGSIAHRVPGVDPDTAERANLGAIARYIQTLNQHDVPGFRALGA
ncbi:hypothetical protein [Ectopseudomonas oleovorans]|uniref:Uncharacterized protein n=1 Tax=Ectopseudomonas oleovorans (strain CECT 5344) TaxID=1182590 RepID=W6RKQ3_ECTO5|nr:hypothetical protein [Pseudomonas oleovorans]CDM42414.1 hypothetical protein BN5_3872 [Pseudomonas oleovorans CECT 5344]CDR93037.1 hypothetical protein PPSAL_3813 [Pseudomonas oleovorans]